MLKVEDRPGVMGEVSRQLGKAVVNINLRLPGNQQAAGVRHDDIAAAKAALAQWPVPGDRGVEPDWHRAACGLFASVVVAVVLFVR